MTSARRIPSAIDPPFGEPGSVPGARWSVLLDERPGARDRFRLGFARVDGGVGAIPDAGAPPPEAQEGLGAWGSEGAKRPTLGVSRGERPLRTYDMRILKSLQYQTLSQILLLPQIPRFRLTGLKGCVVHPVSGSA